MKDLLVKYKPGASVRTHLLLAAFIWTAAGMSLLLRGAISPATGEGFLLLLAGMGAGTLKSLLVLDGAARKNIKRILACSERHCIGGVYSFRMWGLVLLMIVGGRLLRTIASDSFTGFLYLTVGWALILSSRLFWQKWRIAWLETSSSKASTPDEGSQHT
jgi:hypothetical protein